MPATDRREAAAHVFVDDLEHPAPADEDAHHLARVLRLRAGESVVASDGRGGWRWCVWTTDATLEPEEDIEREPAPETPVTIGFSLLKGDRTEWVVQKLTELGVDRIVPFVAERTVVRWDEARAEKHQARLAKVVREAAMQSRRAWLPDLRPVARSSDVVEAAGGQANVALAQFGGSRPTLARPAILVGPEGGWTDREIDAAPATTSLGPAVLRAETAAVSAGVLLTSLRAGVVGEPPPGPARIVP